MSIVKPQMDRGSLEQMYVLNVRMQHLTRRFLAQPFFEWLQWWAREGAM